MAWEQSASGILNGGRSSRMERPKRYFYLMARRFRQDPQLVVSEFASIILLDTNIGVKKLPNHLSIAAV
jgi:hypothetical protein